MSLHIELHGDYITDRRHRGYTSLSAERRMSHQKYIERRGFVLVKRVPTFDIMYEVWILSTTSQKEVRGILCAFYHFTAELVWLGTADKGGVGIASCKITKKRGIGRGTRGGFAETVNVFNESRTVRRRNKPDYQRQYQQSDCIDDAIIKSALRLLIQISGPFGQTYNIHINSKRGCCDRLITHKGETLKEDSQHPD